jgi:hypothetical protein
MADSAPVFEKDTLLFQAQFPFTHPGMALVLLSILTTSQCTTNLSIAETPLIFHRTVSSSETICVNSSLPYFAVVLNKWSDCIVYTHRFLRDQTISDGPYEFHEYSGFDFGSTPESSFDVTPTKDAVMSFGVVTSNPRHHTRVISNRPADSLILASDSPDGLDFTHGQYVQYFNGAHGSRVYHVDMDTDPDDMLSFWHDTAVNFSGVRRSSRQVAEGMVELVTWTSHEENPSHHVKIDIKAPEFKTQAYVRLVTNGNKYCPIPWFKLSEVPVGMIVGIAVAFAVLLGVALFLVFLFRRKKRQQHEKAVNASNMIP